MAQRGGSVETHVRISTHVASPLVAPGSADYVLGRFLDIEWPLVSQALDEAAGVAADWLREGLVKTQIKVNRKPRKAKKERSQNQASGPESPDQTATDSER